MKAPADLTPCERKIFERAAKARGNYTGEDLTAAEVDILAEFARARVRIVELAEMLRTEQAKADLKVYAMLSRQLDATTAAAHKMAKELKLDRQPDPLAALMRE